jgi:hypothetical protein
MYKSWSGRPASLTTRRLNARFQGMRCAARIMGAMLPALTQASACGFCRPAVEAQVFDQRFASTLAVLLLPVVLCVSLAVLMGRFGVAKGDGK